MRYLVLLTAMLLGCPNNPNPPPNPNNSYCQPAQDKLLQLQCKDSRGELLGGPNKHGVSFADRCMQTQNNSVSLAPQCLSMIKNCSEVDGCLQQ